MKLDFIFEIMNFNYKHIKKLNLIVKFKRKEKLSIFALFFSIIFECKCFHLNKNKTKNSNKHILIICLDSKSKMQHKKHVI